MLGETGMGILKLLTVGLCGVLTHCYFENMTLDALRALL